MSVTLRYDLSAVARLQQRIARLADVDRGRLLGVVGVLVESQTRHRIESEKSSPDGQAWQSWSPAYAETRHAGHSLLEGEGHLLDSLTHDVVSDSVEVGSNLVYAGVHQDGIDEVVIVPTHRRTITQAFGQPIDPRTVYVEAYQYRMQLPPRPYLGVSSGNAADLEAEVDRFIDGVLGL